MRSWRSNYRGTGESARTHVCRIHPRLDEGNLSHGPRNISFLERANDVSSPSLLSSSIMSSSVIRARVTRLKRLYPAIKKFPNIIFFLRRVVDLCQCTCEISLENRILALFFVIKLSRDSRNRDCYVEPQHAILQKKNLNFNIRFFLANLWLILLANWIIEINLSSKLRMWGRNFWNAYLYCAYIVGTCVLTCSIFI